MIVLVWVTFLFAPGLPVLFPVALFGIVVLYYTNRASLAYFCSRPKDYNTKVMQTTLNLLKIAPFFYITMGAWVYSNQQVFKDEVNSIKYSQIFMDSGHTL
mmetsp:Transcript_32756/g.40537  ORF Transcript_32756/g.40537 Transcript_32756/m.40537 type:complete len:101 (-) Transcript_32756:798-1100(-)